MERFNTDSPLNRTRARGLNFSGDLVDMDIITDPLSYRAPRLANDDDNDSDASQESDTTVYNATEILPTAEQVASSTRFIDQAYERYVVNNEFGARNARPEPVRLDRIPERQTHRPSNDNDASSRRRQMPSIPQSRSSVPVVPKYSRASGPRKEESDNSETSDLLRTLVAQFTDTVQRVQSHQAVPATQTKRPELRTPRFDGTSDVHMFIRQFREVAELSNWDERVALAQLRSCLDKSAKDCGYADTLSGVYEQLLTMFGLTASEARERLHHLKKEDGENYLRLGNRVERLTRLAYGGLDVHVENQMAIEHFDRALSDYALRQHLLVVRPRTLTEAVTAAESYARVGRRTVSESRGRGLLNRANHINAVSDTDKLPPSSLEQTMESIKVMIEEQSTRIAALERANQNKRPNKSGKNLADEGCWKCGGPHFKRHCPKLQKERGEQPAERSEN